MSSKKPEPLELAGGGVWFRLADDGTARLVCPYNVFKLDLHKLRDWCQDGIDYGPPFVPEVGEVFSFRDSRIIYVRLKLNPDEEKVDYGRFRCLRAHDNKVMWISPDKEFRRVGEGDDDA